MATTETEYETLKSESQIKAEKEHQERLAGMTKVTSRVVIPKDVPLEEIPEVKGLIDRLRAAWQAEQSEVKPIIIHGLVEASKGHNDASVVTVFHDHEVHIKPVSPHEYAALAELPHECSQGCSDIPDFTKAAIRAAEYLNGMQ